MSDALVPDDKNWTWVLERRCGDCGFDASTFDARTTGATIRDLGARWGAVLQRPDARVRFRTTMWSPLEYGCHVRDAVRRFDERLELMLAVVDPHFENWDQDATAVELDYASQEPSAVAAELADASEAFAARFDAVNSDQWARRGFRSDGSVFTVESLARYFVHDPVHHLWDVGAEVPTY